MTVIGTSSNDPIQPSIGFDETSLAVSPTTGTLIATLRGGSIASDNLGSYYRAVLPSGGSWSTPAVSLSQTYVGLPATFYTKSGQFVLFGRMLIGAGNAGTGAAISYDDGVSWGPPADIAIGYGGSTYATGSLLSDGNVGITEAVDVGGVHAILFSALSTNLIYPPDRTNYLNKVTPAITRLTPASITSASTLAGVLDASANANRCFAYAATLSGRTGI